MARKFSLKDNPIFQRLEVPKPREIIEDIVEDKDKGSEPSPIQPVEDHNLTLNNRPSTIDPQIVILPHQDKPKEDNPTALESASALSKASIEIDSDEVDSGDFTKSKAEGQEKASLPSLATEAESDQEQASSFVTREPVDENGERIFDPQNLRVKNKPPHSSFDASQEKVTDHELRTSDYNVSKSIQKQSKSQTAALELEDHFEKSLFFGFYNEVMDRLLPTLNPAEQILYSRLFRLAYGFNRNYCTVSQQLLRERTGLSRNTVRTGLQALVSQQWLHVIEAGNHVSTTYRVVLPREKDEGTKIDPQNRTLKIGPSKNEAQNLRIKHGGSKSDIHEGQKTGLRNLTLKQKKDNFFSKNKSLGESSSKFDPQKLTPLQITDNSLTLSEGERHSIQLQEEKNISAEHIVDTFYILLSQKPASVKRQKSVAECLALLQDGFSVDQVHYAVQWTITKLPGTGSFSRVVHFIDQALKDHGEGKKAAEKERDHESDENYRRLRERKQEEEEKRIDEIRGSLSSDEMEKLTLEATQMVADEHGTLRFGRETLIQIKIRELIRRRHIVS